MLRILATAVLACLTATPAMALIEVVQLPALAPDGTAAEPSVAADGEGGFVLTWQARLADGSTALDFTRVAANGSRGEAGRIASGTGWFVNWADFPSLAVLDNGDWLAHWLERSGPGRYAYDIRVRRSRDRGRTWSVAATLHDDATQSEHGFVAWAPLAGGDAHAVWLDGRASAAAHAAAPVQDAAAAASDPGSAGDQDPQGHQGHEAGAMTLRAARVGRDGVFDAVLLDDRVCDCCQTDAVRTGAQTLVVYRDRSDHEVRDVNLLRHDGRRWRGPEPLFTEGWVVPGCPVNGPAIAAHDGKVLAAAYSEAGGRAAVRLRGSADAGRSWRPAVKLVVDDSLGRLDVAALPGGRFLVAHQVGGGADAELRIDLVDDQDQVAATRVLARADRAHLPGFPRMAVSDDAVLVAWAQVEHGRPGVRVALLRIDAAP
jgi:hypothetical protein